jgi:hypothetical protein
LEDETQSALAAAVDSLPHDQREVLVLKIWNELTFAENRRARWASLKILPHRVIATRWPA